MLSISFAATRFVARTVSTTSLEVQLDRVSDFSSSPSAEPTLTFNGALPGVAATPAAWALIVLAWTCARGIQARRMECDGESAARANGGRVHRRLHGFLHQDVHRVAGSICGLSILRTLHVESPVLSSRGSRGFERWSAWLARRRLSLEHVGSLADLPHSIVCARSQADNRLRFGNACRRPCLRLGELNRRAAPALADNDTSNRKSLSRLRHAPGPAFRTCCGVRPGPETGRIGSAGSARRAAVRHHPARRPGRDDPSRALRIADTPDPQ